MFTALQSVHEAILPNDSILVSRFNNRVTNILPLQKKQDLEFPACIASYLEPYGSGSQRRHAFKCSGGTALWDSIDPCMQMLCQRESLESCPFLIVVTDGDDNKSKTENEETIKSKLYTPKQVSTETSSSLLHQHYISFLSFALQYL